MRARESTVGSILRAARASGYDYRRAEYFASAGRINASLTISSKTPFAWLARRRLWALVGAVALVWACLAYAALPLVWRHYEHQRGLEGRDMVTRTAQGIPGDPLNVGLVGSQADVVCAFHAAGWAPADPVTLASSLRIVGSVVLDLPYPAAPVSPLYLDGRREDLSFQRAAGRSADTRHHVRFWKALDSGQEERPVWLGAASFDRGVGFSRYTLQVTHHIDGDIDAERDGLIAALTSAGVVDGAYEVTGVGPTLMGRNGGGDRYFTDGEIAIARLTPDCAAHAGRAPEMLPGPPAVEWKNRVWRALRSAL
jgi:hypothetical protein